jgi:hypothetical protein
MMVRLTHLCSVDLFNTRSVAAGGTSRWAVVDSETAEEGDGNGKLQPERGDDGDEAKDVKGKSADIEGLVVVGATIDEAGDRDWQEAPDTARDKAGGDGFGEELCVEG